MATQTQKSYIVFTVHDPRLEEEESCVYVGLSSREDVNQCMTAVFREHLPDFAADLGKEGQSAKIKTSGERMDKESALALKAKTIMKYRTSGSTLVNSGNGVGRMFTITTDKELDAVSQQSDSVAATVD